MFLLWLGLGKSSDKWTILVQQNERKHKTIVDINLIVFGIVTDNFPKNFSVFSNILNKYENSNFSILHPKNHSKRTYLFFNPVHFMNNINNLLNSKHFVFPAFGFSDFNIHCPDGYNTCRYKDNIYDFDRNLQSHLKKFPSIS